MIHTEAQKNSESVLMGEVYKLTDAGASLIQVRTREPVRTSLVLRRALLSTEETEYKEWDCVNGFRNFTTANYTDHRISGDGKDFVDALLMVLSELRSPSSSCNAKPNTVHYFVYVDPHPFIKGNPFAVELLQQYAAILPTTNAVIIMVTPDMPLEDVPMGTLLIADMPTPSASELSETLTKLISNSEGNFPDGANLDDEDIRRAAQLGLGLTMAEFETYAAISIIQASTLGRSEFTFDDLASGISQGKTAVVKQSEILELYPTDSMNNVGGMARLKDWLDLRADCFSQEAQEAGVEPPKGVVVVGVPGTGKSLVAKACADKLGIPLVKMDFGRVFSKYVGDSESRVRSALKMVENMAPVVLFVDEIDKGLGGIEGGGGDSGTSSRVLGSFLTWLNDNKAPVFVMVTANRVNNLPPELLRRGRFDQIFSVTLPTAQERLEVLAIHLRKRNRATDFKSADLNRFVMKSDGYVGAEIESAVKDAIVMAFSEKKDLTMDHLIRAFDEMVPMSKSYADKIAAITQWAANNATAVNYPMQEGDVAKLTLDNAAPATRRIGRRTRGE